MSSDVSDGYFQDVQNVFKSLEAEDRMVGIAMEEEEEKKEAPMTEKKQKKEKKEEASLEKGKKKEKQEKKEKAPLEQEKIEKKEKKRRRRFKHGQMEKRSRQSIDFDLTQS